MEFNEIKGKNATDSISGFNGQIVAMGQYIDGYTSVKLQRLSNDGKLLEEWFNINSIRLNEE